MFLKHQINLLKRFMKDCVSLNIGGMAAKFS